MIKASSTRITTLHLKNNLIMSDYTESGFYENGFCDYEFDYDPIQDFPFQDQYDQMEEQQPEQQDSEQQFQQDYQFNYIDTYQDPENNFCLDMNYGYTSSANYSPDTVVSPESASESGSPGVMIQQQQQMQPAPQYTYDINPIQQQQQQQVIQMEPYADSCEGTPAKKRRKDYSSTTSVNGKSSVNLLDDNVVFGSGLTFGQLGKFTSKQLEEIVLKERQKRILTTEEEYKIKKVRRNVKNRESAQLSRKRKMQITSLMLDHIKYLEGQLTAASIPFKSWKSICSASDASSPIMAAAATAIPVQLHAPEGSSAAPSGKIMTSGKRNGAALLFAVVLFSVGIFFTFINSPKSKPAFISETILSTPFVLLPDASSPSAIIAAPTPKHAAPAPAARTMKQIEMSSSALITKEGISPKMPSATESPADESNGINSGILGNTPSDLSRISIAGVQPKIVNPQPWAAKENISYLVCNDVKRYDPPQIQDPSSSTIGILVPSSSLDKVAVAAAAVPQEAKRLGSHQSVSNSVSDDLVEITCAVRDVTVIPRQGFRMVPKSSSY